MKANEAPEKLYFAEFDKAILDAYSIKESAMKWLRKVHNIHIIVNPYTDKKGNHWSFIFDKYSYECWQELGIYITDSWSTYEGGL